MLKIAVFGFYSPDPAWRGGAPAPSSGGDVPVSPVDTRAFMHAVWEMEPPESRIGTAPDVGFVRLTTVTRQPVYVQALDNNMAHGASLLQCDGYIAIIDAVKILAPRAIQSALRRLTELQPAADLIIAAGRQNEPDALSSDEIRAILGLNPDLLVMPYVPSEPKTVQRLMRRMVRYIDNPDRVPPPVFAGDRPCHPVLAPAREAEAQERARERAREHPPQPAPHIHGLDHVAVTVTDLDRALAFYQGVMGFRLLGHIDFPNDSRGRTLTHLDTGRGVLELVSFASDPAGAAPAVEDTRAGMQHLALRVTGLDAIAARLKEAGVTFTREPVTTANGARVAFFRDPDGMLIELIEGDLIFSRR